MENTTLLLDLGGGGYTVSGGAPGVVGGYTVSGGAPGVVGGYTVSGGAPGVVSGYTVSGGAPGVVGGYTVSGGAPGVGGGYTVSGGGPGIVSGYTVSEVSRSYTVSGGAPGVGGGYTVSGGGPGIVGGYTVSGGGPGVGGGYTVSEVSGNYTTSGGGPGVGGGYTVSVGGPGVGGGGYVVSGGGGGAGEVGGQGTALSCFNCSMNLTGYRYILRDEKPFCIRCYEKMFANQCEDCKRPIGTDHKDLSYKEKHWHESCFKCFDCKASLVDRSFAYKNDRTYCADCHDNNFALRCDGCNNIFRAGMKKFEFKGKQYHEQCFSCKVCRQPIGTKTFIPRDQEVVCVPCYEEQYAQRCVKCNGVINKGGITYKNTPWHRECFTCYGCNRQLTGEKFTSREEKPFCSDCFAQFFAKKCCRCVRPITGLGTTKFISFDDRHWHTDCFLCYKCSTSLVGRGFLVSGQDVLCPDCGRA